MESRRQQIDIFFANYISRFLSENEAARYIANKLSNCGVGLIPLIDHCTLRTLDVDKRAEVLFPLGFSHDQVLGTLEFDNWWAQVYRKPRYPSLFVDQAFAGKRGEPSLIPDWVHTHGDQCFYHIAILVENIDHAIEKMKNRKIEFSCQIVDAPNMDLRQIFTQPEIKKNKAFTVLELIKRHNDYQGFLPPQADGLMESSRL